MLRASLFLALVGAGISRTCAQTCIDENGQVVDWWAILKAPHSAGATPNAAAGYAYAYADANAPGLVMSSNSLDSENSALARTLNSLYQAATSPDIGYVFYNDELPESAGGTTSLTCGHAKGVFGFGQSSAFWLLHSVPKGFDGVGSATTFSYPSNGVNYGQSFLCVSLDAKTLDTVGLQLQYYEPQIYSSNFPSQFANSLPNLGALISGTTITDAGSSINELTTINGLNITHFAKNGAWGQELYSALVGPHFEANLFVETWMRPKEDSLYPPDVQYSLVNVLTMQLPSSDLKTYKETQDHSKWAISQDSDHSIVCIGGINHQATQAKRGGGTLCLKHGALYASFAKVVLTTDPLTPDSKEHFVRIQTNNITHV